MDDFAKLYFLCFAIFFFIFGYIFRESISYIYCPLPKYKGEINYGKTYYVSSIHIISSIVFCLLCISLLYEIDAVKKLFNNDAIRISSVVFFWIAGLFSMGLLIEIFLVKTDKEYKDWKDGYLKK